MDSAKSARSSNTCSPEEVPLEAHASSQRSVSVLPEQPHLSLGTGMMMQAPWSAQDVEPSAGPTMFDNLNHIFNVMENVGASLCRVEQSLEVLSNGQHTIVGAVARLDHVLSAGGIAARVRSSRPFRKTRAGTFRSAGSEEGVLPQNFGFARRRSVKRCETLSDSAMLSLSPERTRFEEVDTVSTVSLQNAPDDILGQTSVTQSPFSSKHFDKHFSSELVNSGLPYSWPTCVAVRRHVADLQTEEDVLTVTHDMSVSQVLEELMHVSSRSTITLPNVGPSGSGFVLNPDSSLYLLLQTFGVVVLVADLSLTPFWLAWDVPIEGLALRSFAWFTSVFFSLDIIVSFFTGFYEDGELQMTSAASAKNYFRSWFKVDVTVAIIDWVNLMLVMFVSSEVSLHGLGLMRVLRLSRAFRVCRMLRLVRLFRYFEGVNGRGSEGYTLFNSAMVLVGMAWFCHVMACAWYAIGKWGTRDTGTSWLESNGLEEAPTSFLYASALHWAVVQITLGGIEVVASNSAERMFNIFAVFLGVIFCSSFVSYLSAVIIRKQAEYAHRTGQLRNLRLFCSEQHVDASLVARVQRQVSARLKQNSRLRYGDVEAFRHLSADLHEELRYVFFHRSLTSHVAFRSWSRINESYLRDLCVHSVHFHYLFQDDEVFKEGLDAEHAYHLVSGDLRYRLMAIFRDVGDVWRNGQFQSLSEETWLAEVALWVHWIHVGTATAFSACVLVNIDVDQFWRTMMNHLLIHHIATQYGALVHRCVVEAKPPRYVTDLEVPGATTDEIFSEMDRRTRQLLSLHALRVASQSYLWPRRPPFSTAQIQRDILERGTLLVLEDKGELSRVVKLVAFHVEDDRGRLLVEIGEVEASGGVLADSQIPSVLLAPREAPEDVWQRFFEGPLTNIDIEVKYTRSVCDCQVEESSSTNHGVRMKYLRTVMFGKLVGSMPTSGMCLHKPSNISNKMSSLSMPSVPLIHFRVSLPQMWKPASLPIDFTGACPVFQVPREDGRTFLYGWFSLPKGDVLDARQKSSLDRWVSGSTLFRGAQEVVSSSSGSEFSSFADPSAQ